MFKQSILLLALAAVLAVPALGQEMLEITFNDVPNVACDEVWVQSGVNIKVTSTTAEDCDGGGNCFWGPWSGSSGVGLFPARLDLDLVESYLIFSVEIDIADYCGIGCTRVFLYNNGTLVGNAANAVRGESTIVVAPTGGYADAIAISSCEGVVLGQTIRIFSDTVDVESRSWGMIKGIYR